MTDSSLPKRDTDSDFDTHDGGKVPISHAGPPVWTSSCGAARSVEEPEPSDDVPTAHYGSHAAAAAGPKPVGATSPEARKTPPLPIWLLLLVGGAAAGTLLLIRHLRRRRKDREEMGAPVRVRGEEVFLQLLRSLPGLQPPPSDQQQQPLPLGGRLLVVSDRIDVSGVQTRFGSDAWLLGRQPSTASHAAVQPLVAAGAQPEAVVPSEELGLGPLLTTSPSSLPNPAGRGRINGGGEYGAAVAVAAGHAELALTVDELGSARVPAACCGVYALRSTSGVLPLEGASTASHSLAAAALMASDPLALLRAGEVLRLPGGSSRGDVVNYLVAEDYFAESGPRMRHMLPAVIAAVKRWAGPDQAQGLSLCEWLYHKVGALREFMEQPAHGDGEGEAAARHSRAVLEALACAAEVVQQWEFGQKYGDWVESTAAAAGRSLPPEVAAFQRQARQQVYEARYRSAQAVMHELSNSIRQALQDGYVFVLPTTPGEAPPSADMEQVAAFRQRSLEFAALATLAGVPQVTLPLPVPGEAPLSVSLMSLHKKDLTLLQAAAKLGPLLAEEAARLSAEQAQQGAGADSVAQPPASAASPSQFSAHGNGSSSGGGSNGGRGGGRKGKKGAKAGAGPVEQTLLAERKKEDGNVAFRGGKFEEAVRHYSAAVQLDPNNPVYYANRALAYLKLGQYGLAEEDCNSALNLELNVKALLRRGSARLVQGNAEGAKADFKQVLALEPQNRQAREELTAIQQMEQQLEVATY
ncbi:hypothetical protein N2152v2_006146 [Parachlorella kessleri]